MKRILQILLMSPDLVLGGQAVMEGVMMKGKEHAVVSVRKENGSIVRKTLPCKTRLMIAKIPIVRGAVNLFSVMALGIKALNWSAEQAMEGEEEGKKEGKGWMLGVTLAVSLILSIGFFIFLPYILTTLIPGLSEKQAPVAFNFIDGAIKLTILLIYLYGISRLKDIHRLFQFHGAEHKAVYCYESKQDLTVENTRPFTTYHPRCGTSFILFVILVSILVFSFIPSLIHSFWAVDSFGPISVKALYFSVRILLLPIVAGISYEVLRLSAKHQKKAFFSAVVAPGLWLQRITTQEPGDDQLAVSLDALNHVLVLESTSTPIL